jgi:hypothetical protein
MELSGPIPLVPLGYCGFARDCLDSAHVPARMRWLNEGLYVVGGALSRHFQASMNQAGPGRAEFAPADFQGQFCAKMHDIEPQLRRDPASLGDQWQALRKVVSRTASHQYCERLPRRRSPRQKGPDKKLLLWKFEPVAHVAKLCLQSWL